MKITADILRRSVAGQPFGSFEPFVSGDDDAVAGFYAALLAGLGRSRSIAVAVERDHHGSGYASYVSAFLYPRNGSSRTQRPEYVETTGVLVYLCRLAPIAVFGHSSRTQNSSNTGGSSGFITASNLNRLPAGDWSGLLHEMTQVLDRAGVELLDREPLLEPAPASLEIPTAFDPPYFVFDALFYWCD